MPFDTRIDLESEPWVSLAGHSPLGIITDLDGTLIPFAPTPEEAMPTEATRQLVHNLASLPGVTLAVVSGRPLSVLERFFPMPRTALLVAEHGAWRGGPAGWQSMLSMDSQAIDSLADALSRLRDRFPSAAVERKTWSIALHFRRVPAQDKMGLLVDGSAIIHPWLDAHPEYEELSGAEVIEIRPRKARKSSAVTWVRELLGPEARLLAVGDDVTDEDMFAAMSARDASVVVREPEGRMTAARWALGSVEEVHAFYGWILAMRRGDLPPVPARRPSRVETLPEAVAPGAFFDLLVVSNRLPESRSAAAEMASSRKRNVGGLVSALAPALTTRRGIWLGWSGRTRPDATTAAVGFDKLGEIALAWVDFPEEWHRHYYNGLSNSALWPLLHSFPGRLRLSQEDWEYYEQANENFAAVATKLVGPQSTIWVHDYHLLLLGQALRGRGHRGPIGLFQHVPFPGPDIFFLLPWAPRVLEAMLSFDLIGFHTRGFVENFLHCAASVPGVRIEGQTIVYGDRPTRVGAFPLGIIPADFHESSEATPSEEIAGLMRANGSRRLVLGVDRLDYTKGIPERISAFGSLLEQFPKWRRNASLVQVSVPSRADVPDYAEQRSRIETIVGRINGEYGAADWVPIRYLYRSYGRAQLSELYRAADVGYVTPLRDGMNLVAKEYVAAQDPANPGVLLLSRFAGAADELHDALITNPWYPEGVARDLQRALDMPIDERRDRHSKLVEVISKTTALTWAEDFLRSLAASAAPA